jgi:hypothetical protein
MPQSPPEDWQVRLQLYLRNRQGEQRVDGGLSWRVQFGLGTMFGLVTGAACLLGLWTTHDPGILVVLMLLGIMSLVAIVLMAALLFPYPELRNWLRRVLRRRKG